MRIILELNAGPVEVEWRRVFAATWAAMLLIHSTLGKLN